MVSEELPDRRRLQEHLHDFYASHDKLVQYSGTGIYDEFFSHARAITRLVRDLDIHPALLSDVLEPHPGDLISEELVRYAKDKLRQTSAVEEPVKTLEFFLEDIDKKFSDVKPVLLEFHVQYLKKELASVVASFLRVSLSPAVADALLKMRNHPLIDLRWVERELVCHHRDKALEHYLSGRFDRAVPHLVHLARISHALSEPLSHYDREVKHTSYGASGFLPDLAKQILRLADGGVIRVLPEQYEALKSLAQER